MADYQARGLLHVALSSEIREIGKSYVVLEDSDGRRRLRNDVVVVCVGGILPTASLKEIGINVETKYGTA